MTDLDWNNIDWDNIDWVQVEPVEDPWTGRYLTYAVFAVCGLVALEFLSLAGLLIWWVTE